MNSDDSEEDDSDYDDKETADQSDDDNENESNKLEKKLEPISKKRQRNADELWNEMNAVEFQEISVKMKKALTPFYQQSVFKSNTKKTNATTSISDHKRKKSKSVEIQNMMNLVFGKNKSNSSSSSSSSVSTSKAQSKSSETTSTTNISMKEDIKKAVQNLKQKGKVLEKVKFAGQEIFVKVNGKDIKSSSSTSAGSKQSSSSSSSSSSAAASISNIDNILELLKGPKTISTVTKSSIDWDNYKEEQGLNDILTVAAKDGYLTRQEFLGRCDVRAFEQEKDDRDRIRATQQQSSSGSSAT